MIPNYNYLQNNAFNFTLNRIPETTFRVVECSIPSLTVPPAQGGAIGSPQYFPGTSNEFDVFPCRFIVDEDLKNYEEIYRWITQQRYHIGKDFAPKNEYEKSLVSDGTLITMTNSSTPNRIFRFFDMFPISIGAINFDTTIDSPVPVMCEVEFRYSYFYMVPKV